MNKNARKLIPAVAMLLVSASMLSTASYAWFSMNNKVTAGGMNVNVVTPGDLMISTTTDFSAKKSFAHFLHLIYRKPKCTTFEQLIKYMRSLV